MPQTHQNDNQQIKTHTGLVAAWVSNDHVFRQGGHDKFTTGRTTTSKIRARDCIAIVSWNVRTLRPAGKLKELTHKMERYNWHLLGICEHWKNCGEKDTEEGHTLYSSGEENQHKFGVGVLVHKNIKDTTRMLPSFQQAHLHPP